jgi:hypothetical protein
MKRMCSLLLLISLSTFAVAKKDPAIEARKQFATDFMQLLELQNDAKVVVLAGKEKDVLQIWLPGEGPAGMNLFEQRYVEALKKSPKIKEVGFHSIQLKSDVFSITFPKGVWDIPID